MGIVLDTKFVEERLDKAGISAVDAKRTQIVLLQYFVGEDRDLLVSLLFLVKPNMTHVYF